jgi:hypothetical protein
MADPKKVTRLGWTADLVDAFAPSAAANPFGPLSAPGDVLQGSYLYEITDGPRRALMAVRPLDLTHGRRLDIVGLVSLGDRLHAGYMLDQAVPLIAAEHGADVLAMCTQRAHIVRQCARRGWEISGVVMNLKAPHVRQ